MPGRNDTWRYPKVPADDAPRADHEAYARGPKAFGATDVPDAFFWLPCPRCGKMFGGHEVAYKPLPGGNRITCCPDPLTDE